MDRFIIFLVCFTVIFGMYQCKSTTIAEERASIKKIEEMKQESEVTKLINDIQLNDVCMRAVSMSCIYADCATMPIEKIQEKVCGQINEQ